MFVCNVFFLLWHTTEKLDISFCHTNLISLYVNYYAGHPEIRHAKRGMCFLIPGSGVIVHVYTLHRVRRFFFLNSSSYGIFKLSAWNFKTVFVRSRLYFMQSDKFGNIIFFECCDVLKDAYWNTELKWRISLHKWKAKLSLQNRKLCKAEFRLFIYIYYI